MAVEYGCGRPSDLYAELGYGKWSARQVLAKAAGVPLAEQPEVKPPKIVSTVKRMLECASRPSAYEVMTT